MQIQFFGFNQLGDREVHVQGDLVEMGVFDIWWRIWTMHSSNHRVGFMFEKD
jgi:hypothetical protein